MLSAEHSGAEGTHWIRSCSLSATHLSVLTMKIVSCHRPCCFSDSVTLPAASSMAYCVQTATGRVVTLLRKTPRTDADAKNKKHETRNFLSILYC